MDAANGNASTQRHGRLAPVHHEAGPALAARVEDGSVGSHTGRHTACAYNVPLLCSRFECVQCVGGVYFPIPRDSAEEEGGAVLQDRAALALALAAAGGGEGDGGEACGQ